MIAARPRLAEPAARGGASGLTAEAAVERVQNDARARLQRQTDPYLRDRLHDLDRHRQPPAAPARRPEPVLQPSELPENAILVARSMSPAALLDYDRSRLRGLVLEEAGASSHVAIVARALSIPAVSDMPNITEIVEQGDADHRRRSHRRSAGAPARRTSRRPMARRRGCARDSRTSIARCATCRASPSTASRSACT